MAVLYSKSGENLSASDFFEDEKAIEVLSKRYDAKQEHPYPYLGVFIYYLYPTIGDEVYTHKLGIEHTYLIRRTEKCDNGHLMDYYEDYEKKVKELFNKLSLPIHGNVNNNIIGFSICDGNDK